MRIGVFGGSFDPVHNGHLRLAECCAEQAGLDTVWFMPSAVQPFKRRGPVATDADRLAMLRLATADRPAFEVSTLEVDRGGVSYTVDTLREVRRQRPDDELFLLMGADTLSDVLKWKAPREVLRLATPLAVRRPGESIPADAPEHVLAEMPPHDVSSSTIRGRLARGESCEGMAPAAVLAFARERGLYPSAE